MKISVGSNVTAIWTNDQAGGKITIEGRGATNDFEGGLESGGSGLGGFIKKISSNSNIGFLTICYAIGLFNEKDPKSICESLQSADNKDITVSDEEIQILKTILPSINKIKTIEFKEGITKIGSHFICNSSNIDTLILPSTLIEIDNAMSETSFVNSILIPDSVIIIGDTPFSEGCTLNMKRANNTGMTIGARILYKLYS